MTKPAPDWHPDEQIDAGISLQEMLDQLLRYWRRIVLCMLAFAVLAAGFAWLRPKFEASGFYYTPGWTLADLKRFKSEFGSQEVLVSVLDEARARERSGAELLIARSGDAGFWDRSVRPLHPLTRKDAKEIFESKDRDASVVLGLELSVAGRDPLIARDAVMLLGDFLNQTLMLTTLQNWVATAQSASNGERLKIDNQVLQTRYSIEQSGRRIADLRELQTKYPESNRMDTRQVVNADANSARYLAPIAQVVALESSVAEANESLRRIERRSNQLKLESTYFDAAAKLARTTQNGWSLWENLAAAKQELFRPLNLEDDLVRETSNRLDLDLKGFKDQFSIAFGFRSPVMEPTRSSRSAAKLGLMGAALGLLLASVAALVPLLIGERRRLESAVLEFPSSPAELRQHAA